MNTRVMPKCNCVVIGQCYVSLSSPQMHWPPVESATDSTTTILLVFMHTCDVKNQLFLFGSWLVIPRHIDLDLRMVSKPIS